MGQVRLILIGGFLGAGKTTLLAQAAQRLVARGQRVGLITNDQAAHLVDTELLKGAGLGVTEIAGGCFCCKFENLIASANQLIQELRPDVLIGEPVGSCTDLSATVIQPLKKLYPHKFRIAPFSVLADPSRLRECLAPTGESRLPDSVMYVFRKQLEEADRIVLNKADLLSDAELAELREATARQFADVAIDVISARTGSGVDAWLDAVCRDGAAGRHIAEVDYDTYAEGEAVLGWLNASALVRAAAGTDWADFAHSFLTGLQGELAARGAEIAHVKLFLSTSRGSVAANVTSTDAEPFVRADVAGAPRQAHLTVNARVHIGPEALRQVVEACLATAAGGEIAVELTSMRSFSPARPEPTHRFDAVV